ncbi:peptidoglycan bridge formation glycyltransferase FemA/FemB family protein [Candidatus Uhrbacteria bacterium]|nr:peptidoglycan bridge formation glycyltransferase FemA/FemB family protein [Candidatus Uhrbacteria bacterium]
MKVVTNKEDWNDFVSDHGPRSGAFLQSWEWGELQEELGHEVSRYATSDARAQLVEHKLPAGQTYHYIPRGPVSKSAASSSDLLKLLADDLAEDIFLRVDPVHTFSTTDLNLSVKNTKDVQPSATLITSLIQNESDLLEEMHGKTRYNIRLAEKRGVQIKIGVEDALGAFVDLVTETSTRHGIRAHDRKHYEMILKHLDGSDNAPRAFLTIATHDGDILATAMCLDWNGTRTYLHGASSDIKKNLMAPHLLHWKLVDDAKSHGLTAYDWWGIAPEGQPEHPLQGVTRFKKGFGGEIVASPSTIDLVIKPLWYRAYTFMKKFK